MKSPTHFFKESVYRDGVRYQHVIGLNEEYDWRLILDLTGDPAWQFITVKKPPVLRFPRGGGPSRNTRGFMRLFVKKTVYRCPCCHTRLKACEDRYPDGQARLFPLPPRPSSFELWHDDDLHCPHCRARLGINLPSAPSLPAPGQPRLTGALSAGGLSAGGLSGMTRGGKRGGEPVRGYNSLGSRPRGYLPPVHALPLAAVR